MTISRGVTLLVVVAVATLGSCSSDDGSGLQTQATGTATSAAATVAITNAPSATVAGASVPAATTTSVSPPAPTASTVSIAATTTIQPIGPAPNDTLDLAVEREGLAGLLLNPSDLGPSFIEPGAEIPPGRTPCGFDIDEQFPATGVANTVVQSSELGLAMLQEIRVYRSTGDAVAAYDAVVEGLSCGGNAEFTLGPVTDISADVDASAIAVQVTSAAGQGVIIVAELAEVIVGFQFQSTANSTTGAPSPIDLARAGIGRIIEYVEA